MKIKILVLVLGLLFLCLSVQSKEKIKPCEEFLSRAVEFHGHLSRYRVNVEGIDTIMDKFLENYENSEYVIIEGCE